MQNNIEQEKASICATHFVYAICRAPLGNILTLSQLTTYWGCKKGQQRGILKGHQEAFGDDARLSPWLWQLCHQSTHRSKFTKLCLLSIYVYSMSIKIRWTFFFLKSSWNAPVTLIANVGKSEVSKKDSGRKNRRNSLFCPLFSI